MIKNNTAFYNNKSLIKEPVISIFIMTKKKIPNLQNWGK